MPDLPSRTSFPEGFLFGTATSAYQIEGHSFGHAGPCHWDSFAATPGNVHGMEDGSIACDHYHRYREDLALAAAAGFDAYRFSTSWARVQPEGKGAGNPEGLDFYDRLIDAVLAAGLKPMVTLYHWELPSAQADRGGWANRETAERFADFTRLVMARIGDRAFATAPINEPWCVAQLSHFLGAHAPGLRDIRAATRAMHHVNLAHGLSVAAMRAEGIGNIGCVNNHEAALPADDSPAARDATRRFDTWMNRAWAEPMLKGAYPAELLEGVGKYLPEGWQDDMTTIAAQLDWYGINYYTRKLIRPAPGPFPACEAIEGDLDKTDMGWEIYPQGLTDLLVWLKDEITGGLPIYVTENGMARDDRLVAGRVDDPERTDFIARHLAAAHEAIAQGVPLAGFIVWSLLDNYEWALGYAKRFGLVHVDFDSLRRTPKASYEALKLALSRDA